MSLPPGRKGAVHSRRTRFHFTFGKDFDVQRRTASGSYKGSKDSLKGGNLVHVQVFAKFWEGGKLIGVAGGANECRVNYSGPN